MSNFPSIPTPTLERESLRDSIAALKQTVELLTGVRGDGTMRAFRKGEADAVLKPYSPPEMYLSQLPDAAAYPRALVYLIDPASNAHIIFSDGAVWRYTDGTAV